MKREFLLELIWEQQLSEVSVLIKKISSGHVVYYLTFFGGVQNPWNFRIPLFLAEALYKYAKVMNEVPKKKTMSVF